MSVDYNTTKCSLSLDQSVISPTPFLHLETCFAKFSLVQFQEHSSLQTHPSPVSLPRWKITAQREDSFNVRLGWRCCDQVQCQLGNVRILAFLQKPILQSIRFFRQGVEFDQVETEVILLCRCCCTIPLSVVWPPGCELEALGWRQATTVLPHRFTIFSVATNDTLIFLTIALAWDRTRA